MSDEHTDTVSRAPSDPESGSPNPTSNPVPAVAQSEPVAGSMPAASGSDGASGAPKKRRRRGSRGGRNRRKPGSAPGGQNQGQGQGQAQGQGPGGQPNRGGGRRAPNRAAREPDADEGDGLHDYTAAAADRGLTSDDLAADAKEDAGLVPPTGPDAPMVTAKPQIGDTRPAP